MKKITLATFKSFVRKNRSELMIKSHSHFDGMIDGIEFNRNPQWYKPSEWLANSEHTLGLCGIWLVLGSRDRFTIHDEPGYYGIHCYNCCGSFTVAIKK